MFFYVEALPPMSNSIFMLFVWIVLAKFFSDVFPNVNKRFLICATLAGIFFWLYDIRRKYFFFRYNGGKWTENLAKHICRNAIFYRDCNLALYVYAEI